MPGLHHVIILLICFIAISTHAQQPPDDRQISQWVKELSVKKDSRNVKLLKVSGEIFAMDSSTWCTTIERIYTSPKSNTRSQIRARIILHSFEPRGIKCPGQSLSMEYLHAALQAAYEIEDEALQSDLHLSLGQIYNSIAEYGIASMHFLMFFDILSRNHHEDFLHPNGAIYDLSFSLYHTHEYAACINAGLNALLVSSDPRFSPDDTLNMYQQMQQWNTIGLAYLKTQKPDSAFIAFDHAEKLATTMHDSFWMGIINGNKGDVYYQLGQYDSAYVLLKYDYDRSVTAQQFDNAANSLQWIARIDARKGQPKIALQKLTTARQFLRQQPQPNYLANVYFAFSQVYTTLGKADSVNTYLQQYLHLHDSLETEIAKSRTEILQVRMNNHDQIQTIKILNRQKKQIAQSRNFTIAIVLLLGCIAYMLMNRFRLKMQLRQRQAVEDKRIAEGEAQKAIEQLDVFRQHLLEKNMLIEEWQKASETKEYSADQIRRLSDLTHHLILNDEDWIRFKELFDSVYPGFFISLRNKVPDITQAEQRMAALSKLKLTAKEAANLIGVSPNTIYTTRRRLRQRLGLEQDADLDPYFNEN